MKRAMIFFTVVLVIAELNAQQKGVTVFESGMEGHKSYRIPAIISLPNGDILAFAEGRKNNASDFGDINIVQKRSKDKGKTWTELQTIVDYAALQAGNPAPVVDLTDPKYPAGRVFLFYNTGNNHEGEVRKGKGLREVWYITSSDGGQTWSEAVNITLQVHRPNQPAVNRAARRLSVRPSAAVMSAWLSRSAPGCSSGPGLMWLWASLRSGEALASRVS